MPSPTSQTNRPIGFRLLDNGAAVGPAYDTVIRPEELVRREVAASDARHLAGVLEHGGKLAPLGTINADGTTNVAVSSRRFDLLNEALCKLRKAAGLVPLEVDDGVA